MKRFMFAVCFTILGLLLFPGIASARSEKTFSYSMTMIWNSCIRLIRVDMGLHIVEKDRKSGYILFEYNEVGMQSPASIEFIPEGKDGADGVKTLVTLAKLPSYVERKLLDRLDSKLLEEYGMPSLVPRSQNQAQQEKKDQPKDEKGAEKDKKKSPEDENEKEEENENEKEEEGETGK